MKKMLLAALICGSVFADVPLDTPLTSGGLMLSVRPLEMGNGLQVFLHTADPETYKFEVTAVISANGKEQIIRGSVNKYPSNVPGVFWTVFTIPTIGSPEKVLNVTVEEMKPPKTTDFR